MNKTHDRERQCNIFRLHAKEIWKHPKAAIFIDLIKILRSVGIELFKCILHKCFDLICILLHFHRPIVHFHHSLPTFYLMFNAFCAYKNWVLLAMKFVCWDCWARSIYYLGIARVLNLVCWKKIEQNVSLFATDTLLYFFF